MKSCKKRHCFDNPLLAQIRPGSLSKQCLFFQLFILLALPWTLRARRKLVMMQSAGLPRRNFLLRSWSARVSVAITVKRAGMAMRALLPMESMNSKSAQISRKHPSARLGLPVRLALLTAHLPMDARSCEVQ